VTKVAAGSVFENRTEGAADPSMTQLVEPKPVGMPLHATYAALHCASRQTMQAGASGDAVHSERHFAPEHCKRSSAQAAQPLVMPS
jgi:hypothetical protein